MLSVAFPAQISLQATILSIGLALLPPPTQSGPTVTNLGVAHERVKRTSVSRAPGVIGFVWENQIQVDVNGDGDLYDMVPQVLFTNGGPPLTIGMATPHSVTWQARFAAFRGRTVVHVVGEASHGHQDLNGDGDTEDGVLFLFDLQSGTSVNVGIAVDNTSLEVREGWVFFAAPEADNGVDYNFDGDMLDRVLHRIPPSSNVAANTALAVSAPKVMSGDGSLWVFQVSEMDQGADLNGDGDQLDEVVHLYDSKANVLTNFGVSRSTLAAAAGRRLAMHVDESLGGNDLNGDGDLSDQVVHLLDADTGVLTNTGLASGVSGVPPHPLMMTQEILAVAIPEFAQRGTDLNGDGDMADLVVHTINLATSAQFNAGLALSKWGAILGPLVGFKVREKSQGNQDLNGDGDTGDGVLYVVDGAAGTVHATGHAIVAVTLSESLALYAVSEVAQGSTDLDGDGFIGSSVWHHLDLQSGQTKNLKLQAFSLPGYWALAGENWIAFAARESYLGQTDLNGDGDSWDFVLHLFDGATGAVHNLGLAAALVVPSEFGKRVGDQLWFRVSEHGQGGTDLDGDGIVGQGVVHRLDVR